MAEIKVPIQVNLPDDWVEQIVDRLRNDPDAEWVEIIPEVRAHTRSGRRLMDSRSIRKMLEGDFA